MKKPIILIGGASGTGKSTLANHLSCQLDLDHRLGTGFIRAVIQAETSTEAEPFIFSRTSQSHEPNANLRQQAVRLKPAIYNCIVRAVDEGTSLIIEGSHLLPELYASTKVSLFLILDAGDEVMHHHRINGERHDKRHISDIEFEGARLINDYYLQTAKQFHISVINYEDNLQEIIKLLS